MHNFSVSNSFSTASISTTTSQDSQLGTADGQHPQGSFMGLLTTPDTPAEFTQILSTYYQQDELRLLSDIHVSNIGASKTNPFEALATHQTVTFGDDNQGQSASPLSLSNEPSRSQKSSQSVDDVLPIVSEEQSLDPTDKWIIIALTRHMPAHHTFERRFRCKICGRRFKLQHHLRRHKEHVHFIKSKKKSPNHRVFLNLLLLRPQALLRVQVRLLPGFLCQNRRLGNVNKAHSLIFRRLSICRNQRTQ